MVLACCVDNINKGPKGPLFNVLNNYNSSKASILDCVLGCLEQ